MLLCSDLQASPLHVCGQHGLEVGVQAVIRRTKGAVSHQVTRLPVGRELREEGGSTERASRVVVEGAHEARPAERVSADRGSRLAQDGET